MKHLKGFLSFAFNFYSDFHWTDLLLQKKNVLIRYINIPITPKKNNPTLAIKLPEKKNKQTLSFILLLLSLLLTNSVAHSAAIAIYSDSTKNISIGGQIQILEDNTNKLSIHEAASSDSYKTTTLEVPNLGVSNSSFWLKISIKNTSDEGRLLLELLHPIMDEVELYSPTLVNDSFSVIKTGDNYNFHDRKYDSQNFIFDINIPKNESRTYYMKIKSGELIVVPIRIGTSQTIFESNLIKDVLFGIYFGVILSMFLYNLFIYFTVRDKSYLFYITYVIFIALTQAALQGYTFKYLWPGSPWFANHSITLFPSIAGFATVGFIRSFLQSKKIVPKLDWGLNIIVLIYILSLIANFILNNQNLSYNLIDLDATLISLYALIIAIVIAIKGYRSAKFFLLAWTVFLIGVIGFVLKSVGVLPNNNFTDYTMSAGTTLEVLLFSFALADRINIL
ncbi:MAG TPA: 7TM diverse intracellular signaling domain-containing protein, partial [Bacteroidia bacterium]|nr:7TM diverse intracellular signaling domain-containing protein [Bacteroidia bacterium]